MPWDAGPSHAGGRSGAARRQDTEKDCHNFAAAESTARPAKHAASQDLQPSTPIQKAGDVSGACHEYWWRSGILRRSIDRQAAFSMDSAGRGVQDRRPTEERE
jgi:hypothetical protein